MACGDIRDFVFAGWVSGSGGERCVLLDDTVQRNVRDPMRKLGSNDRIFGTMALALEQGIEPVNLALGAAAAIVFILKNAAKYNLPPVETVWKLQDKQIEELLLEIWSKDVSDKSDELIEYTQRAYKHLKNNGGCPKDS